MAETVSLSWFFAGVLLGGVIGVVGTVMGAWLVGEFVANVEDK